MKNSLNKLETIYKMIHINTSETMICQGGSHHLSDSEYKFDAVPKELFLKYPDKKYSNELFKTCDDCRTYVRILEIERQKELLLASQQINNEKYRTCTNRDHSKPYIGSSFPVNQVPIEKFYKKDGEPNSGLYKTCFDCRIAQINKKNKKKKIKLNIVKEVPNVEDPNTKYQACSSDGHHKKSRGSKYPKDKVPLTMFLKEDTDPNSPEYYKTCFDCRNYTENNRDKKRKQREAILRNGLPKFINCLNISHKASGSEYGPEKVPIEKFLNPNDPDAPPRDSCIDCTKHLSQVARERERLVRLKAESMGMYACHCMKIFSKEEMATNKDGSLSRQCKQCKIETYRRLEEQKDFMQFLKKQFINQHGCSCQKCKCLFLIPEEKDSLIPRELKTYLKDDGKRYVTFESIEYDVESFLVKFDNLLELRIIEFDHLTEEEQRKRGLLKENEKFIKKKRTVRNMLSVKGKINESKKCQHLCARCHLEETLQREGTSIKQGLVKLKADYVNNLKRCGCSNCGYKNDAILRYFEMDHLDPKGKIMSVCDMVNDYNYSLEDLIRECNKCRILCRHCHLIHSYHQREQGIFVKYIYEDVKYEYEDENEDYEDENEDYD